MMRRWPFFAYALPLLAYCLLQPGVTDAGPVLIGGSADGMIYDVDPLTGAASNPRDTGIEALQGLAFSPDGVLFARSSSIVGSPDFLYTIDPSNGNSEVVGEIGPGIQGLDFDFDPTTGILYGTAPILGGDGGFLFTLATDTAATTIIGSGPPRSAALAINQTGQMYAVDPFEGVLEELDRANGDSLVSIPLSLDLLIVGTAFAPDGTLLVVDGGPNATDSLYALDLQSGLLVAVGSTGLDNGLTSLAYIPEPGTFALFLISIGALVKRRKRRHAVSALIICGFVTLSAASPAHAGPVLIGGQPSGIIYDIDPLTGAASNPRDTGIVGLWGLAFSPDGVLFGRNSFVPSSPDSLYTIDLGTGKSELVGELGGSGGALDVDFDPATGSLFGTSNGLGGGGAALYTIAPGNSTATLVGFVTPRSTSVAINSLGQLYALGLVDDLLYELDKTNGDTLGSTPLGIDLATAGTAFAADGSLLIVGGVFRTIDNLYVFDIPTGSLITVGPTGVHDGLTSLAYVPEPGTLTLLGLCVAMALTPRIRARNRRRQL